MASRHIFYIIFNKVFGQLKIEFLCPLYKTEILRYTLGMKEKDTVERVLESYNDVFADIANALE